MLTAAESIITYRRRYRSQAQLETRARPPADRRGNPRSLAYQLDRLADDLAALPEHRARRAGCRPGAARARGVDARCAWPTPQLLRSADDDGPAPATSSTSSTRSSAAAPGHRRRRRRRPLRAPPPPAHRHAAHRAGGPRAGASPHDRVPRRPPHRVPLRRPRCRRATARRTCCPATCPARRAVVHAVEIEPAPLRPARADRLLRQPGAVLRHPASRTRELTVTPTSKVDVQAPARLSRCSPTSRGRSVRDRLRRRAATTSCRRRAAVRARFAVGRVVARAVATTPRRRSRPGGRLIDALRDLAERIHADFVYEPGRDVGAPPRSTRLLERRKGVCQDFAHLADRAACDRSGSPRAT